MTIMNVRSEHLPQIAALERACFSLPWSEAQLASQLGEGHVFLCACEGDTVLGYVGLLYVLDEGYISNIAVSPAYRRRGIAAALLTALKERSRDLSLSFLTLEVRESNASAIALYEKHGFQAVGRRKNYYQKPAEDAILMTWEGERRP